MADLRPAAESNRASSDAASVQPGRQATVGTPRWVYLFGIAMLVFVVLLVVMHLTGHSLGGHMA
jgi:hypothetical protein